MQHRLRQRDAEITQTFFATVQNKLHWAITGMTAAEIVATRAEADKPHMGLDHLEERAGRARSSSRTSAVAKNYLTADELRELKRIVGMYLDYAENQAARQRPMRMADWAEKLDAFLHFNEYEVLADAGRVSHEVARQLAETEYDAFRVAQDRDYIGDFEREAQRLTQEHEGE